MCVIAVVDGFVLYVFWFLLHLFVIGLMCTVNTANIHGDLNCNITVVNLRYLGGIKFYDQIHNISIQVSSN